MNTKLTTFSDIRKRLNVAYGFDDDFKCEYILDGVHKTYEPTPVELAKKLKEFGFIEDYSKEYEFSDVRVRWSDTEKDYNDLLEDFMNGFGQFGAIQFIAHLELTKEVRAVADKIYNDKMNHYQKKIAAIDYADSLLKQLID
jgi:hypothetical protein